MKENTVGLNCSDRSILALQSVLIFAVAVSIYLGSLRNGLLWDDNDLIIGDKRIQSVARWPELFTTAFFTPDNVGRSASYFRPLVSLSYGVDYYLAAGTRRLWVYHLHNTVLYGLCCVVVLIMYNRAVRHRTWIPFFGCLVFATHLMHTENAAWVSGRTDVYAAVLMVVCWLVYDSGLGKKGVPYHCWLAGCMAFLALLAKEVAIAILPLLFLWEWAVAGTFAKALSRWRRLVPVGLAVALYLVLRWHALKGITTGIEGRHFDPFSAAGLATVSYTVWAYLGKLLFPVWSSAEFEIEPFKTLVGAKQILSIAGFVALILWTEAILLRRPRKAFALMWFGLTLAPVLNIVPIAETAAERFLFVPSVGAGLLLVMLLDTGFDGVCGTPGRIRRLKVASVASLLIVSVSMGASVIRRVPEWRRPYSLFCSNVRTAPDNPRSNLMLGFVCHTAQDRHDMAMLHYRWALEAKPTMAAAHNNLGKLECRVGELVTGLGHLMTAKSLSGRDSAIRFNLAKAYIELALRNPKRKAYWLIAKKELDEAVNMNPNYSDTYYLRGLWHLYQVGHENSAIADLQKAIALSPSYAPAYYHLGEAWRRKGEKSKAAKAYERALQIDPNLGSKMKALDKPVSEGH